MMIYLNLIYTYQWLDIAEKDIWIPIFIFYLNSTKHLGFYPINNRDKQFAYF